MKDKILRLAAFAADGQIGNPEIARKNAVEAALEADRTGVDVLLFPLLSLTGATANDLYRTDLLFDAAEREVTAFLAETEGTKTVACLGVPLKIAGKKHIAQIAAAGGKILGISLQNQPDDCRIFSPAPKNAVEIQYAGQTVSASSAYTLEAFETTEKNGAKIGFIIGNDVSPKFGKDLSVILHPAAEPETVWESSRRIALAEKITEKGGAFVTAEAGLSESGTDFVFAAHHVIAANGEVISEAKPFNQALLIADVNLTRIGTFDAKSKQIFAKRYTEADEFRRFASSKLPFLELPENGSAAILEIQAQGLALRMRRSYSKCAVLGVSGGLDSTLAMLVAARACDILGISRKNLVSLTMPGFGTTPRTRSNAEILAEALGADFSTVSIADAVRLHFKDIHHDETNTNVTFENAQARERTQILMDIANDRGGLVVGTGDLSELALGFATYNGDHMAMYAVNAGVTKTLIRKIVTDYADAVRAESKVLADALIDIVATPVSPELLPPKDGEIEQKTEGIVGPYELHDFFLYHFVGLGETPAQILCAAERAFDGDYDRETVRGWLKMFLRRFFSQQFKRSCLPDGPKVGAISLSPRGAWMMPSDASSSAWLMNSEEQA